MKRWIHASTNTIDNGFLFTQGNKAIFLKSNSSNITVRVVKDIINAVCDWKGVSNDVRQEALSSDDAIKDFRRRISKATLEHVDNDVVEYYSIQGNGFTLNFPADDFDKEVTVVEGSE